MRKNILLGLAVTAALLGTALEQPAYAQSTAGTSAGAGVSAGARTPAGGAGGQIGAGATINAPAAGTCPSGAPMPPNGACPPSRTRTSQPRAGASATTSTNTGAAATSTTSAGGNAPASTTGNAAAGANTRPGAPGGNPPAANAAPNFNVTVQQRTQIGDAIRSLRVRPARPEFSVRIGTVVPRHFALRPLPAPLLKIVPRYRGYLFFVLPDGRIAIVQPRTLRIVAII